MNGACPVLFPIEVSTFSHLRYMLAQEEILSQKVLRKVWESRVYWSYITFTTRDTPYCTKKEKTKGSRWGCFFSHDAGSSPPATIRYLFRPGTNSIPTLHPKVLYPQIQEDHWRSYLFLNGIVSIELEANLYLGNCLEITVSIPFTKLVNWFWLDQGFKYWWMESGISW